MVRAVLGAAQHLNPVAQVRTKPGSVRSGAGTAGQPMLAMSHLND